MKKIVLALMSVFCVSGLVFGAESKSSSSGLIEFSNVNSDDSCSFKCREVLDKTNYKTILTDFDLEQGISYCSVVDINTPSYTTIPGIEANFYSKCSNDGGNSINKIMQTIAINNSIETKTFTSNSGGTTLSQYFTSLVTLSNIDKKDVNTILISKKSNTSQKLTGSISGNNKSEYEMLYDGQNMLKGFNDANIQYFSDLFNGMSTVYKHLQNLLFVVVGGFFLASIGGAKLQRYLENKGESTGQNQPYLHKFFIPLLCVGIFYMPISKSVNSNGEITATTTVIQELIRYFTREANNIADVASSIGAKTYMNKITNNLKAGGVYKPDYVAQLNIKRDTIKLLINRGQNIWNMCYNTYYPHFGNAITSLANQQISNLSFDGGVFSSKNSFAETKNSFNETFKKIDLKNKQGTIITLEACAKFITMSQTLDKMLEKTNDLLSIKNSDGNTKGENKSDKVKNAMNDFSSSITKREKELGWINTIFMPSAGLFFEVQPAVSNLSPNSLEALLKSEKDYQKAKNNNIVDTFEQKIKGIAGKIVDFVFDSNVIEKAKEQMHKLPYMMLPGAGTLYNFFESLPAIVRAGISYAKISSDPSIEGSNAVVEVGSQALVGAYFGLDMVYFIYKKALQYIPVLTVSIATSLAFAGYLVSLCKYFYISPFVVAFSLTTKRLDKIVNFLVTGITIFFKPVLIVLFTYLALFLHTLVKEILTFSAIGQFMEISFSAMDVSGLIMKGVIIGLLEMMGSLAACYVVWKTIINGPDWTFKLIGLDKDADNVIAQGLSSKLETRAVMV